MTDLGAQSFTCRGSAHTSAAGMVMAFNPEDPHDGHATDQLGFTYRIVHIGPELVTGVLADVTARRSGHPLFAQPVVEDPVLARNLRALHTALFGGAPALRREELLAATVLSIVRRAATQRFSNRSLSLPLSGSLPPNAPAQGIARARDLLHEHYLADTTLDDLAVAAGCSRYALYRAFQSTYGMAPSDYQRQVRLRAARRLIAGGMRLSEVAAQVGFADQGHLTRWFHRYFGMTPGEYRRATMGT